VFDGERWCVWTSGMPVSASRACPRPLWAAIRGAAAPLIFDSLVLLGRGTHDRCLRRRPGRAGCCKGKQRGLWLLGVSTRRVRVGDDDLIDNAQI